MRNAIFLLCVIALFSGISCSKDKNDDFILRVEIDGEEFTTNTFTGTLMYEEFNGRTFGRLDLTTTLNGGIFTITVHNFDWQNPPADGVLVKKYDTNQNVTNGPNTQCLILDQVGYCDLGLGTYIFLTGNYYSTFDMNSQENGIIEITANDTGKKTVSGNFDFDVVSFTGQKISFSGEFNDAKYKVQ